MLKIKPEERPKVIMLAASIVLVLCIFCFTVIPRLLPHGPNGELLIGAAASAHATPASTSSPAPVASARPTMTAPVGGATTAGATPTPNANGMAAPLLTGSTEVADPFWRPLALANAQKGGSASPQSKPTPPPPAEPHPTGKAAGFSPVAGGTPIQLPKIAPPQLPDVELQGIVQDDAAIAVLNVGGQTRFLKAGQPLEAGWVVARIQTASVTLKQGLREVTLTLGQTMQKDPAVSTPKETPQETVGSHRLAETLPPFHSVSLQP